MVLARQAKCACMNAKRLKQTSKNGKISRSGDNIPINYTKIATGKVSERLLQRPLQVYS
jgi:hypothetical protein